MLTEAPTLMLISGPPALVLLDHPTHRRVGWSILRNFAVAQLCLTAQSAPTRLRSLDNSLRNLVFALP
jgi:hypothetical protein